MFLACFQLAPRHSAPQSHTSQTLESWQVCPFLTVEHVHELATNYMRAIRFFFFERKTWRPQSWKSTRRHLPSKMENKIDPVFFFGTFPSKLYDRLFIKWTIVLFFFFLKKDYQIFRLDKTVLSLRNLGFGTDKTVRVQTCSTSFCIHAQPVKYT